MHLMMTRNEDPYMPEAKPVTNKKGPRETIELGVTL